MRPVRLLLVIPILLALALTLPLAEASLIDITSEESFAVNFDDTVTYNVKVQNNDDRAHTLRLRPASFSWGDIFFDTNLIYLQPGAVQKVKATVTPPRDVRIGVYDVQVMAIDDREPDVRGVGLLRLIVNSELPHIDANFITGAAVDPGPTDIDLIVKNSGALSQADLKGAFVTPFGDAQSFDIGFLDIEDAKVLWQGVLDIPFNAAPEVYPFTFIVYQDGTEVSRTVKYVNVREKETVQVDDLVSKNFLQERHVMTLTNVGNVDADNEYSVQMSTLAQIFTTSSPGADVGSIPVGRELSWDYNLAQGDIAEITYMISYIPILEIALSMVLLIYVMAFYYRQEVHVVKEIEPHGNSLKVKLTAKGGSRNMLKSVVIEDFVPTPLKLQKDFGSVHPKSIKREGGRVKMVWKLDNLYPGDERVFTYTMKTSLGVIGNVLLPAAKAKAKVDGKTKVFYSNKLSVKGKVNVSELEEEKPEK